MSTNTTLPAFPGGQVVTAAQLNALVNAINGIQAAWDTWTPTYTGLSLGNGQSSIARYVQIGKTVLYRLTFTAGSTTTFSGAFTFSLPVPIRTDYNAGYDRIGGAMFLDSQAAASRTVGGVYVASVVASTAGMIVDRLGGTYATSAVVGPTVPWTWGATDTFAVDGAYEAA